MSDSAIRTALSQKAQLERDVASLTARLSTKRAELEKTERFIESWLDFASPEEKAALDFEPRVLDTSGVYQKVQNPKKEDVASAAVEIIRAYGAPMSREKLARALAERGIQLTGEDPDKVLSTMLWRMKDAVVRLPGFGYWPANDPYARAGYDPEERRKQVDALIDMVMKKTD